MSWTINGSTLADLGIEDLVRTQRSLATGTVTFSAPAATALTADSLFFYGDTVTIARNGVTWFTGRINTLPRFATGRAERVDYEVVDAWWYLENTIWQQAWTVQNDDGEDVTKTKSRVLLFTNEAGDAVSASDVATDILQAAIDAGADFQIGTISVPVSPTPDELKDATCAEALRRVLRWSPQCVSWFDHTTTPPTLHIQPRASLSSLDVALDDEVISTLSITPRYDLQPPGVVINYEVRNTVDGADYVQIVKDKHPTDASETAPRTVVLTIPMQGTQVTTLKQQVRTRPIAANPAPGPADVTNTFNWLKYHFPIFAHARNLSIGTAASGLLAPSRVLADPDGTDGSGDYELADPNDPASEKIRLDATLPRELVDGVIAPWMTGIKAQAQTISLWVKYEINENYGKLDEEGAPLPEVWVQKPTPGTAESDSIKADHELFSVTVMATDATTRLYSSIGSFAGGEAIPDGLAKDFYNQVHPLHWSGSVTLTDTELMSGVHPGRTLNITGGRSEWATMGAMIQQVTETVLTGQTNITFGAPEHLGPQDLIEYTRALRTGGCRVSYADRQSGNEKDLALGSKGVIRKGISPTGGSGSARLPLEPYVLTASGPKVVAITPGTLGGLLVGSAEAPVTVGTASGTGIIEATVTTDTDGFPTSVSFAFVEGTTPTDDDDTHFHLTVGTYDATGDTAVVARALGGSQSFVRCLVPYSSPTEYVGTWQLI